MHFLADLVRASGHDSETILQLDVSRGMGDDVVRAVASFVCEHGKCCATRSRVAAVEEQMRE